MLVRAVRSLSLNKYPGSTSNSFLLSHDTHIVRVRIDTLDVHCTNLQECDVVMHNV